jgi:glycosyltransferase involved in cell wall biosynthesis
VVPHGIDVDPAAGEAAAARARLGLDERFTALCFGFLAPYKGLETALRAADLAGDGVHLVIAGGEHPRMAGDGYADGLRALGPATFAGPVPDADVRDWFAAADVALFPYPRPHATSGPLALALGAGTPVLLSEALAACAGAPATLAVPADPVALGGRLAMLAADEAARDALAAASAALARDRSWPQVARRHLEVYAEVAR